MAKHPHGDHRYLVETGIPERFAAPVTTRLSYSRHAHGRFTTRVLRSARLSGQANVCTLPRHLDLTVAKLIAVDTLEGELHGQLWRVPLDTERDLILVLNAEGRVVTLWVVERDNAFPLRKPSVNAAAQGQPAAGG